MMFEKTRKANAIKLESNLMYLDMCPRCQMMVLHNPDVKMEDYCDACKVSIKPHLEKIARLMK